MTKPSKNKTALKSGQSKRIRRLILQLAEVKAERDWLQKEINKRDHETYSTRGLDSFELALIEQRRLEQAIYLDDSRKARAVMLELAKLKNQSCVECQKLL